jgi:hypothetical protein
VKVEKVHEECCLGKESLEKHIDEFCPRCQAAVALAVRQQKALFPVEKMSPHATAAITHFGRGGRSEEKAFWKNEPILHFSKNHSKCLMNNSLRLKMKVVKKRQFKKRTHFENLPQRLERLR